jgi:phosphoserine phosphatase
MKIAFDVDSTLIDDEDKPRYDVIDLFRWFECHGHEMIIWSGGGIEYSKHWADKLGLNAVVVEKCSIGVDIVVDDMMEQENWGKDHRCGVVIKV